MYDVVTFGSATLDLFLEVDRFKIKKGSIIFPFGSKIPVNSLRSSTGGGGTNTCATFALQGLKTAYCGSIGRDFAGSEILRDLSTLGIDTGLVVQKDHISTNLSTIFLSGGDRTAFVYREASEALDKNDVNWDVLRSKWIYFAPLSGKLSSVFSEIVGWARDNKVQVMANPGNSQIESGFRDMLKDVDVLLLNIEEASLLTGVSKKREKRIIKNLFEDFDGLLIVTRGEDGALVSDGTSLWTTPVLKVDVMDKTGAGDAFGSGFLAGQIKGLSIEESLQIAVANASSCVTRRGAKKGLLGQNDVWERVEVKKEAL